MLTKVHIVTRMHRHSKHTMAEQVSTQGSADGEWGHLLAHPLCDSLVVLLLYIPLSKLHGHTSGEDREHPPAMYCSAKRRRQKEEV